MQVLEQVLKKKKIPWTLVKSWWRLGNSQVVQWLGLHALVLAPHTTFSACLLPVEHFSQRISLIREGRNAETNENNQRGLNNNVVIKHSQGPLVPPQELWIIFWAISCELSIDTKAAGRKVNYRATWLQPGLELPQFRELTGKKWEETDLETEF